MCVTCGCGTDETHPHDHEHGHDHEHSHDHHDHSHAHPHSHPHGSGLAAHGHAPQGRLIAIEQDILAKNAGFAGENRQLFARSGVFALNLVSSPGSGKTTLLSRTVRTLGTEFPVAVIGGDQQTANDAERIRAAGAPAVQINTGKGCHLDAHGVGHALEQLPLPEGGILFIENVGNLVCPADFDLGEAHKVVVLSVTEGEDKPLKYANMFAAADLMLLNKIDLLPHVDFDVAQCLEYARRVHPTIQILQLSARTGEGMSAWLDWLRQGQQAALAQQAARLEMELATVRARLAQAAG